MERHYQNLEHCKVCSFRIWGASREELFQNASLALVDTIADSTCVIPKREMEWSITGASPEEIMMHQLEEVLHLFEEEDMIFSDFQIRLRGLGDYKCLAHGERLDPQRHHFKQKIKHILCQTFSVGEKKKPWTAQVSFDF